MRTGAGILSVVGLILGRGAHGASEIDFRAAGTVMVEGGWFNTKDTKKVTKDTKGPGRVRGREPGTLEGLTRAAS